MLFEMVYPLLYWRKRIPRMDVAAPYTAIWHIFNQLLFLLANP